MFAVNAVLHLPMIKVIFSNVDWDDTCYVRMSCISHWITSVDYDYWSCDSSDDHNCIKSSQYIKDLVV